MGKQFVTDIVGEDYKKWKSGQNVLISTSTGSGKTWFVLNCLLPYAKAQGKHVVYYCNRRILSMQVQASAQRKLYAELGEDEENLAPYFHIRTYQHTEHTKDYPNVLAVDENGDVQTGCYEVKAESVLYYVFDEAMYMVQDASFNSSTNYWYKKAKLTKTIQGVSVFLTATPEPFYLYQKICNGGLEEACLKFLSKYYVKQDLSFSDWAYYLGYDLNVQKKRIQEAVGDPYAELFQWVGSTYNTNYNRADYYYTDSRDLPQRYDYVDTHYFDEMDSLAHVIAESVRNSIRKEKEERRKRETDAEEEKDIQGAWLVFVRSLEDAQSLRIALKTLDCASTVISSKFTSRYDAKLVKRKSSRKIVFDRLVNEEYLQTHVLISTSVIDCGVTLHARNTPNLVICQPDKTSFLQMLGRIRVEGNERINLYIQSYTPKQVKGHMDKSVREFIFLAQFLMINKTVQKSMFGPYPEGNFLDPKDNSLRFMLSNGTREYLIQELERDKEKWRYLVTKGKPRKRRCDLDSIRDITVNELAVIYYLSQVYYFKKLLPEYDQDPYYFLKEQLSWIGKLYDPFCWIDYERTREELRSFLEAKSLEGVPMDAGAQEEFKEECFERIRRLRDPSAEVSRIRARYSIGSKKFPGKWSLNRIFVNTGIPYQIWSKQNKKRLIDKETGEYILDSRTGKPKIDDKSYWTVVPADLVPLQELEQERRQEKQRQKEEKQAKQDKMVAQQALERQRALQEQEKRKHTMRLEVKKGDETLIEKEVMVKAHVERGAEKEPAGPAIQTVLVRGEKKLTD